MMHWYHDLYMDDRVAKNPERCKKRVMRRRPWKRSYYAITLAANEANLFEIIGTRQLFFRRYAYLDLYIIGLATDYQGAVALLQKIIADICGKDKEFRPREYFDKDDFENSEPEGK